MQSGVYFQSNLPNCLAKRRQDCVLAAITLLIPVFFLISCKKDTEDTGETLPDFGTCVSTPPSGGMSMSTDGKYTYQTHEGGKIVIDHDLSLIISYEEYPGFSLQYWGAVPGGAASYNHENMNGKHVKDRVGDRRTIVFPDGAKITWYVSEHLGPVVSITIYDNDQVHHINPICNTLEFSGGNGDLAKKLDDKEADGETATFKITATGLEYNNIYTEASPGNKNMELVPISDLTKDYPNQVNDYWP